MFDFHTENLESIRKRNEVLGIPTAKTKKTSATLGNTNDAQFDHLSSPRSKSTFMSTRLEHTYNNALSPRLAGGSSNAMVVNDHSYKLGTQSVQQKEALERVMQRKKKERQMELERAAEDIRKKKQAKDELDQKAEALKRKTEERLAQHRAAKAMKDKEVKEKELEEAKRKQERLDTHHATEKQRLKAIRDETRQRLLNKEAEKERKAKHEERMIRLKLR